MKKIFAILGLMGTLAVSVTAQEAAGESWSRLYRRIPDIKQKYAVMQNIIPLDDRALEPFLSAALDELVYGNLAYFRESPRTYDDWEILTRTIIMELGDIKGQSAAGTVWDVVEYAEVPLLKAEGLIALGRMRAVEYASDIAMILRNLNFNTNSNRDAAEIEAYGAVAALDKMKEDVGFEPLFYASVGWYQDRITDYAARLLLSSFEQPVEKLRTLMLTATDYRDKRSALNLALQTDSPDSEKAAAAVDALAEGLKYAESDSTLRRRLANLRMDAISGLISLGESNPDAPVLLDQAIDEGDLDEALIAVQALGVDGSDAAVGVLTQRLGSFNERQDSGLALNREELTLTRQIIFAMGEAGNQLALQVLRETAYTDYTPALVRQANEAVEKITGN